MSATITIPADLEQRIAGFAAAQGKNLQQMAIEALALIFDPAEELEDARTLRALESARRGEGRPAKEVLEEIRLMLGIAVDAKRPAQ
jgi:predicted transcriptional regulator